MSIYDTQGTESAEVQPAEPDAERDGGREREDDGEDQGDAERQEPQGTPE